MCFRNFILGGTNSEAIYYFDCYADAGFTIPAFAADGSTYDVKYMASNLQEVYNQIAEAEFPDGGGSISRPPASLERILLHLYLVKMRRERLIFML